jgi:hypothetical protein
MYFILKMVQCIFCRKVCNAKYGPNYDLCKEHNRVYTNGKLFFMDVNNPPWWWGKEEFRYADRVIKNPNSAQNKYILYDTYHTVKKNHGIRVIQAAFRRAISDPSYKMCRDRLTREFNSDTLVCQ